MFEPRPSAFMAANAMSTPTGSIRIATKALRTCRRNTMQTSATIRLSSISVRRSVSIAAWIRCRAIIDGLELNAFRQAGGHLGDALLDVVDDIKRVGAETLQDDAAGHLAFAVQFG